jgi:hypothetical protein
MNVRVIARFNMWEVWIGLNDDHLDLPELESETFIIAAETTEKAAREKAAKELKRMALSLLVEG